jgi:methylated-DNA-protein-cysteine methyltransferase related protein
VPAGQPDVGRTAPGVNAAAGDGERSADGFAAAVRAVVAGTAPGDVLAYGDVAAEAGRPGAARAVGNVLAGSGDGLPWWRVVTAGGRLVPGLEDDHARRLRAEGVVVDPSTGKVTAPARPRRRR